MKALRILAAAIGLASLAAPVKNIAAPTHESESRIAIDSRSTSRRVIVPRNIDGVASALPSSGARRFLNQRQYRKKVRSNPCLLRSKKHRSKN